MPHPNDLPNFNSKRRFHMAYFKGFQVLVQIGGEKNRGAIGSEGVDSGQEKILEFFAYKYVNLGNCKC